MKKFAWLLFYFALIPKISFAYTQLEHHDKGTHYVITDHAISQSKIGQYLEDYFAIELDDEFAGPMQKQISLANMPTVREWINYGGDWEDGSTISNRPFQHFYDPTTGRGLTGGFWPNPIWANSVSDWSWQKTREFFYRALQSSDIKKKELNFAQTFRGLGQIVHLLQDMAVPAHTRNDAHLPFFPVAKYQEDMFEKYAAYNMNTLTYNGYDPPSSTFINDFYSFWHTNDRGQCGLADFTNRNFLSRGTNLDDATRYTAPKAENILFIEQKNIKPVNSDQSTTQDIYVKYATGIVMDSFSGPKPINHLAAYSYFDAESQELLAEPVYSLDAECHKEYLSFLIPRATAYSAGLLKYFFRGKLEITESAIIGGDENGITMIKTKFYNTTQANNQMPGGKLFIVAKYKKNPESDEFSYAVSEENTNANDISEDAGNPDEAIFNFSTNKIPADFCSLFLQIVYSGTIGEEKDTGIAVSKYIELNKEYALIKIEGRGVTKAFVWDPLKNTYANIKKADGSPIIFPCDVQSLSDWQNSKQNIGSNLYTIGSSFGDQILQCSIGDECTIIGSCEEYNDSGMFDRSGNELMNYVFISADSNCDENMHVFLSRISEVYFGYNLNCNNNSDIRTSFLKKHTYFSSIINQFECDGSCLADESSNREYKAFTIFGPLYEYNLNKYEKCNINSEPNSSYSDWISKSFNGERYIYSKSTILHLYYFQYLMNSTTSNCASLPYNIPGECYGTEWSECATDETYEKSPIYIHAQIDLLDGNNKNPLELKRNLTFEAAIKLLKNSWQSAAGSEPFYQLYEYNITAALIQ